jgi:hypothetical protein
MWCTWEGSTEGVYGDVVAFAFYVDDWERSIWSSHFILGHLGIGSRRDS